MAAEKMAEMDVVSENANKDEESNIAKAMAMPTTNLEELAPQISETKLIWKIDCWVMPTLACLFFLSSLDKQNIANAKIFNLAEDLHLQNTEYNNCLVIYFVAYVVFDIPMTIAMRVVKPHIWLSLCTFFFGLVTLLQGLVHSYAGLLATRFFLGICEACSFSGCFYLIGSWYRRSEAQKRFTFFYSSIQLAGAFAGLLASAIGLLDGRNGWSGWRWIFVLEGAFTAFCAIGFWFLLPDFPEQTRAKWLSEGEREFVVARLTQDRGAEDVSMDHMTVGGVVRIIRQPKVLLGGLMYFTFVIPAYGYGYFNPTIIHTYTKSQIRTQLLSVPPWACGFVASLMMAWISDRVKHRYLFIIGPLCLAVAAYGMLLGIHHTPHAQYGALFLLVVGIWSALPVMICWFTMNIAGHARRSVALGWQIGFGNIGGIPAVYLFLQSQAPFYTQGYGASLALILLTMLLSTAYLAVAWTENRAKERKLREDDTKEKNVELMAADDLHPAFKNML